MRVGFDAFSKKCRIAGVGIGRATDREDQLDDDQKRLLDRSKSRSRKSS